MPAGVRQSPLPGAVDIPYQPERASRWLTLGRPQGGTVDFVKESSAPQRCMAQPDLYLAAARRCANAL